MLRISILVCLLFLHARAPAQDLPFTSCGRDFQLSSAPQKILAIDINAVEIVLTLDPAAALTATAAVIEPSLLLSDLRPAFAAVPSISSSYPNLEAIERSGADFVIAGWNAGYFANSSVTPQELTARGIASYALQETCGKVGLIEAARIESSSFSDIRQIARILRKEEQAEKLIAGMAVRLARIEADVASRGRPEPVRIFVYDSGDDAPYTAGAQAVLSDVIKRAGGVPIAAESVSGNWGLSSWEAVAAEAPEMILIVDYGYGDGLRKMKKLLARPDLQSIPAIAQSRFFIAPYAAAVSGVRSVGLAEQIADHLICSFSTSQLTGDFTCFDQPYSPVP